MVLAPHVPEIYYGDYISLKRAVNRFAVPPSSGFLGESLAVVQGAVVGLTEDDAPRMPNRVGAEVWKTKSKQQVDTEG